MQSDRLSKSCAVKKKSQKTKTSCNGRTAYTLHQKSARTSVTCTQKTGSKELDSKKTSYFYENGIAFNAAASSSFGLMTEESMNFARQNPLQTTKYLTTTNFLGNSLTKHMSPRRNLLLRFLLFQKIMEQL